MTQAAAPPRRSRRGSGAVTLHDVAKLAGVAPITASRALRTGWTGQEAAELAARRTLSVSDGSPSTMAM